ncbi:hypothetical protein [Microseira wollei]|uniref:hypothetical protein n=1 Tax=Microseira wollei TaxID=467598 RepID=UPI001CFEBD42|nr:hypothetical protein [Microseira wollei]
MPCPESRGTAISSYGVVDQLKHAVPLHPEIYFPALLSGHGNIKLLGSRPAQTWRAPKVGARQHQVMG